MSRLDRFVVALVFLVTLISAVIQRQSDHQPPPSSPGRRPVPVSPPPSASPLPTPPPLAEPVRRPPIQQPPAVEPLVIVMAEPRTGNVTGTAFSIDPRGIWATARHVTNSCSQIIVQVGARYLPANLLYSHQNADLVILSTAQGTAALPVAERAPDIGEYGFSVGFPQGRLGAAQASLLGRSRMQLAGRLSGTAPVLTWAEIERFPDSLPSLGGLSGAPVVDSRGSVVGVLVASSLRRGRIHSVAPEILEEVHRETTALGPRVPQPVDGMATHRHALEKLASAATERSRIVKVYCRAPTSS